MDLARWSQHETWLRHVKNNEDGPEPAPGFKDCPNCPIRPTTAKERRANLCSQCPYEEAAKADGENLPTSPGERFFLALELSGYPPEALNYQVLTIRELRDLKAMRDYNQSKRDTMMMQAMMGGVVKRVTPGGS